MNFILEKFLNVHKRIKDMSTELIDSESSKEILNQSSDSGQTTITETVEVIKTPEVEPTPEPKKTKEKKPTPYVLHAEGEYAKEPILRMGGKSNIDLSKVQILTLLSGGHRYKYIKTQVHWS